MRDDLPVAAATAVAGTAALIYDNQQAATLLIGGIVDNVVGKSLDHAWAALTSHPPVTLAAVATVGAFGVVQQFRLHRQSIS